MNPFQLYAVCQTNQATLVLQQKLSYHPHKKKKKKKKKTLANSAYMVKRVSNKITNCKNYGRMPATGGTQIVHWHKIAAKLERVLKINAASKLYMRHIIFLSLGNRNKTKKSEAGKTNNGRSKSECGPTQPKYTVTHRGYFDMQQFTNARDSMPSTRPQELIIRVELPLLKSAAPVQLDVYEKV